MIKGTRYLLLKNPWNLPPAERQRLSSVVKLHSPTAGGSSFHQNQHDRGCSFHPYLINDDGTGLEQVTSVGNFNSFPMFSPDGKQVVGVSDRDATTPASSTSFGLIGCHDGVMCYES